MGKMGWIIIGLFILTIISCKVQEPNNVKIHDADEETKRTSTENRAKIKNIKTYYNLTDLLRGISGVKINGYGANATIVIRGQESFELSSEPLFIIGGVQYKRSYSSLYSSIAIDQVKS